MYMLKYCTVAYLLGMLVPRMDHIILLHKCHTFNKKIGYYEINAIDKTC